EWAKFSRHFARVAKELPQTVQPSGENRASVSAQAVIADVRGFLECELIKVLGLKAGQPIPGRRGFFDMGMDSLTSVELRNRLQSGLQIPLPSTLTFKYPNLDTLTAFVEREMASTRNSGALSSNKAGIELDNEAGEHLDALMDEKLEALEKMMGGKGF
ncbi:MAG: stiG, partial [Verrucomicrobiales bacterium]|nr:stiG [Verrucomicrobiales bacterium]